MGWLIFIVGVIIALIGYGRGFLIEPNGAIQQIIQELALTQGAIGIAIAVIGLACTRIVFALSPNSRVFESQGRSFYKGRLIGTLEGGKYRYQVADRPFETREEAILFIDHGENVVLDLVNEVLPSGRPARRSP